MGSATDAFFAKQDASNQAANTAARNAAKLRKQQLRNTRRSERRELPGLRREMDAKLQRLSELVSAHKRWSTVNFVRGGGYYFALASYEIDQTDDYENLYLRIRQTVFGDTQLSVGFLRGWSYVHLERVELNNIWVRRIIKHVDSRIELLKFCPHP